MKTNKIIKTIGMSTVGIFGIGSIAIPTMLLSSCSTAETEISIETDKTTLIQDRTNPQSAKITTSITPTGVSEPITLTAVGTVEDIITFEVDKDDSGTGTLTVAAGVSITSSQTVAITATCDGVTDTVDITVNQANTEITITTEDGLTAVTQSYQSDATLDIIAIVIPGISNPIVWAVKGILPEYEEIITLVPNEIDKNKVTLTIKKGEEIKEDQKITIVASCGQTTSEIEITVNAFNNVEKLAYTEVEGGYSVMAAGGVTISGRLIIPDEYNGLPVVAIADRGFYDQDEITWALNGWKVTSIGSRAFALCDKLTYTCFYHDVASIGNYAFESCNALNNMLFYGSTPPVLGDYIFAGIGDYSIELIGQENYETYKNTSVSGWTYEIKSHIAPPR